MKKQLSDVEKKLIDLSYGLIKEEHRFNIQIFIFIFTIIAGIAVSLFKENGGVTITAPLVLLAAIVFLVRYQFTQSDLRYATNELIGTILSDDEKLDKYQLSKRSLLNRILFGIQMGLLFFVFLLLLQVDNRTAMMLAGIFAVILAFSGRMIY